MPKSSWMCKKAQKQIKSPNNARYYVSQDMSPQYNKETVTANVQYSKMSF